MSKWSKTLNDTIITTEFDLHDVLCGLTHLDFDCQKKDDRDQVDHVILRAVGCQGKDGKKIIMSEKARKALEIRVNKLIKQMQKLDCFLHDVAEYTCM